MKIAFAMIFSVGLSACVPSRAYDRASGGSTQYIDQLSDEQKAEARNKIAQTLNRGLDKYNLGIGDEFEIFFHVDHRPAPHEYLITVSDKLRVDFLNETETNRVVEVQPDGRISIPLLGTATAAGKTVNELARELEHRYAGVLTHPQITVSEVETHSQLADFVDVVGGSKGRSIIDKVLPDGTISLPRLPLLPARGRSLEELKGDIDKAYAAVGLDISVSLIPRSLKAGTALVFGEVGRPGRIDTDRPQTVLMTIAEAGGVLSTGSMQAIRVFYVADDGLPHVRSVNLEHVIDGLKLEEDMIVPVNAVIYVPPTDLAKTGRFMDAVLRDVFRFQGITFGGNYVINDNTGGSTAVITK